MKLRLCLLAFLWPVLNAIAQPAVRHAHLPLKVGDTFPDLIIHNLYNSTDTAIDLASLKDKLVLFDFWATWCTGCIQAFPKINELKSELKDSLYVLLVTSSNNPVTPEMLDRSLKRYAERTGKPLTYPAILNDSLISGFFNIPSMPHYVWLWNGRIQAITSSAAVPVGWVRGLMKTPSSSTKNY